MTIGESIRYHRLKLELTQAQLGERIGVSAQAVSKWENNTGLPDISMAVPLARALGTTTDELLRFGERYQEFEDRWKHALRYRGNDDEALLAVALDALKEFPFDKIYLYRAAFQQYRLAEAAEDPDVSADYIGRALANAQLYYEADRTETSATFRKSLWEKVIADDKGRYVLKNKVK